MTQEIFNLAQRQHQAGKLGDAQANYRAVLEANPGHAAAMHFLGLTELQMGRREAALELMGRAMKLESGRADFWCNYGLTLSASGRAEEAAAAYRRALELNPDYAEAHNNLGIALVALGEMEKAIEEYRAAIARRGNYPEAYNNLGSALQPVKKLDEAIEAFEMALKMRPEFVEAQNNLGNALLDAGRIEEARDAYSRALTAARKLPQSFYGMGNALRKLGQLDEAIAAFGEALEMRPDYVEAYTNLGEALLASGRVGQAVSTLAKAVELAGDHATILYNYANALMQDGKYELAKTMFHRALEKKGDYPEALSNLGNAMLAQGQIEEALGVYDRAIEMHPDFALAHWNRSFALFVTGDWDQAWREYEWRWKVESFNLKRPTRGEQWDGGDLRGRRILLYTEQGFGDAIQFFRFARVVADRGGEVIVQAPGELVRLFRQGTGMEIVAAEEGLPEFDVHYPLLSLPLLLGTRLETIPARAAYLFADPDLVKQWREKIPADPGVLKVGLVWRGRAMPDAQRSIPSELLEKLGSVENVWFMNLQVGHSAAAPPFAIADFRDEMKDFAETAAAMANLDLVLTIDSAAAHLAGALGVRTWTMLKFVPDWRWLRDREDSPFYPTMRLFRQSSPGDWTGVIERVAEEMKLLVEMRKVGAGKY
jgi:tetratricopeptide (TPR) repeat protein